ncbi:MAG TPA: 30S ribosomal protein S6 [Bacteroidia bacterium]|nr:30S ribosomal protein S6 [Bacteroidia bacterium]HNS12686.1 30S ribosomal protein S6 [Bacteroidia bacterium]
MSNQYEVVFIMTPVLSEEQMMDTVTKFKKILSAEGGSEIVHENNWGLRKLAYPIQKKNTGFYYLIEFKAPGDVIAKLEIEFKRDERIMRFLTVRLDKHAIIYNEKKRKNAAAKKEEVEKIVS